MNTTLTLIQNANSLGISISRLLTYMSIVLKNSDMEPDKIIKDFPQLLERITKIWANDDSKDWNKIKSIQKKEIEMVNKDTDINVKTFDRIITIRLHSYNSLSTFEKSELLTALAGEEYRNILLALFENYNKGRDADAVNMIATVMLDDVYNNQNGGTNNG